MSKAEKFITDCTRNCSNEIEWSAEGFSFRDYFHWLTPCQARRAVEIEREEILKEVKKKLLNMLQTSADNSHFFEQLDEYIDKLENKQ